MDLSQLDTINQLNRQLSDIQQMLRAVVSDNRTEGVILTVINDSRSSDPNLPYSTFKIDVTAVDKESQTKNILKFLRDYEIVIIAKLNSLGVNVNF